MALAALHSLHINAAVQFSWSIIIAFVNGTDSQREYSASGAFEDEAEIRSERVPCLGAVTEERLRLRVSIAIGVPRLVPPGSFTVSGHYLPVGIKVSVPLYTSNQSSRNFSKPEMFDPERWLTKAGNESTKNYAFNCFSIGPRNCIGMQLAVCVESRLILARLLWSFDSELAEAMGWYWDWVRQKIYVLWKKDALTVKLRARTMMETSDVVDTSPKNNKEWLQRGQGCLDEITPLGNVEVHPLAQRRAQ